MCGGDAARSGFHGTRLVANLRVSALPGFLFFNPADGGAKAQRANGISDTGLLCDKAGERSELSFIEVDKMETDGELALREGG